MSTKHVHKYQRIFLGGSSHISYKNGERILVKRPKSEQVLRCMIVDCPNYIKPALAINRTSICWLCGKEMIIDNENIKLTKPTHKECREIYG